MAAPLRTINFTLNGRRVSAEIAPHRNLIELLQEQFDLYGARESCGQGLCGCCTVLVDGKAVSGCLYLAVFVDGTDVETVEHRRRQRLDPVQEAFIETGAFQCGFCTPGFVLMAHQLLDEHAEADRRRDPPLSLRQSLPLRRLSGDHPGGQACRPQTGGGTLRVIGRVACSLIDPPDIRESFQ